MGQLDRIAAASRAFCVLVAFALSAITRDVIGLQYTLVLALLGAAAWWVSYARAWSHSATAAAEGTVAGVIIGLQAAEPQLYPYLLAPALIAGLSGGLFPLLVCAAGLAAGLLVPSSIGSTTGVLHERVQVMSPWLLISLGSGLLGAWLKIIGLGPSTTVADRSYESARRLLGQLRTVARRLSSGLDPVTIAEELQDLLTEATGAGRIAVFVTSDRGPLTPLLYRGYRASEELDPRDPIVRDCWETAEPTCARGRERAGWRFAVPIRAGSRMVGVVVGDQCESSPMAQIDHWIADIDVLALRLETALAFDDVRSLATMEERKRLAREIHDGVAQEIASLGYLVDDALANQDEGIPSEQLREVRAEISRIVGELRLSIFDLRSDVQTASSLGTALADFVQRVGGRSDMTVHITLDEGPVRLRKEVETELLRIAQEAVNNARKHSGARNLWVDCRVQPPNAWIIIRDDGLGLGEPRLDSYGIKMMRERAARVGARLEVLSHVASRPPGTTVSVSVGQQLERMNSVLQLDGSSG